MAITNDHKLSDLKQHTVISVVPEVRKFEVGLTVSGVSKYAFLLEAPEENLCPYLFLILEAVCIAPTSASITTTTLLILLHSFFPEDSCDYSSSPG